jgi:putative endopeptidase
MDRTVVVKSPADLYRLANGRWLDETPIPASKGFVANYTTMYDENLRYLRSIAERAEKHRANPKTAEGMVGLFYGMAMDTVRADRLGITPLKAELLRIDQVRDKPSLMREIARLDEIGVVPAFSVSVAQDEKNIKRMLLVLGQGGVTLPDRESYFGNDARSREVRESLVRTFTEMLQTAGYSSGAREQAREALMMETEFARGASSPVEMRNLSANYHLANRAALRDLAPAVPWDVYFSGLKVSKSLLLNISEVRFVQAFNQMVATQPMSQWRSYLRCQTLFEYAPYLSKRLDDEHFRLLQSLFGLKSPSPRWLRSLRTLDSLIGDAVGQLYVKEKFSPQSKKRVLKLVGSLIATLRQRIPELAWMSGPTKAEALKKLAAMRVKIGYPDHWRNYARLTLRPDSYAQNVIRARVFEWHRQLSKLGKPIDRDEWFRTATTVDANYGNTWNEIVFPAGILQPGYYDDKADDAYNYGAIGSVIGHEITHGFDDRGAQFDGYGNRRDWWTPADKQRFIGATDRIVEQYRGYKTNTGLPIDGKLTLSENIADIGGLNLAYLAYHKALGDKTSSVEDGLTGDQRFFVAWSQVWRYKARTEFEKVDIAVNEHSPGPVRAVGAVADCAAFYKAFGLTVPSDLPRVW